jgi:hypothetical protein
MLNILPASTLAARWLSQLRELTSAIGRDPSDSFAWRRHIRIKLLSFLLSRYGGDPSLGFNSEEAVRPTCGKTSLQKQDAKPFRQQSVIRTMLDRIAESNTERRTCDDS